MENKIFALDIGTRTVVGLVLEFHGDKPRVLAAEIQEHRERTMLDGQIHDVPRVAGLVIKVKEALEEKIDFKLSKVAVAAAGRALKTASASVTRGHTALKEIDEKLVLALEIEAVQAAQRNLADKEQRLADYHCVGYSVAGYNLDGQPIGNLVGQFGSSVGVEIIATFLPRVVVDSLLNVVQRAGLELSSLTLEPIAALNVIIPGNMRQLNIALVDIGAGTSDIAVTSKGRIIGYAMVPAAGDEITEVLCEQYLLDFNTAERVKRCLTDEAGSVEFCDVVGVGHQVSSSDIIAAIKPVVDDLAKKIAGGILEINNKPPQAVIAIGGGSQTPLLTRALAEKLSLTRQRVAVRGREALEIEGQEDVLTGPQAVTPIGIGVSWRQNRALQFSDIKVNGRPARLISANGSGTVADALLAAGINARQLYGKPGLGKSITVNGKIQFIKGTLGQPAAIAVNGEKATLDTQVGSGDQISITPGQKGKDARLTVKDLLDRQFLPGEYLVNGKKQLVRPRITVNGSQVDIRTEIPDKAMVDVVFPQTLKNLLQWLDMAYENKQLLVNGKVVSGDTPVKSGDTIEIRDAHPEPPAGKKVTLKVNGKALAIEKESLILADLFNHINFNPSPPSATSKLRLTVNGKKARFITELKEGDDVTIRWE